MDQPRLKTVFVTRGHTKALRDGTVKPRTFDFEFEEVPTIINAFRRMVRGLEFDISEMAITTYLCARAYGKAFTAIPVFPMRAFHHGAILHNTKAGIRGPKDLEGRRVGVNRGYTVTTGVWARSISTGWISTGLPGCCRAMSTSPNTSRRPMLSQLKRARRWKTCWPPARFRRRLASRSIHPT